MGIGARKAARSSLCTNTDQTELRSTAEIACVLATRGRFMLHSWKVTVHLASLCHCGFACPGSGFSRPITVRPEQRRSSQPTTLYRHVVSRGAGKPRLSSISRGFFLAPVESSPLVAGCVYCPPAGLASCCLFNLRVRFVQRPATSKGLSSLLLKSELVRHV